MGEEHGIESVMLKENILEVANRDLKNEGLSSFSSDEDGQSLVFSETVDIRALVHIIRGKQVMLDSDLAMLYAVETKYLNRAASRNSDRFPEDFRFQLAKAEYENLKCQIGTSSSGDSGYGGRRTLPYVYTEQGIAMLSGVLRSETAIRVSVDIMRAFVEMRKFIANNAALFERISAVELKQLEYQKQTNERFDCVFDVIDRQQEPSQKVFFEGQVYDAFSLLVQLVGNAKDKIVLIDGYVDVATLNILAKKKPGVAVLIHTSRRTSGRGLSKADIDTFNSQYPSLIVHHSGEFHDRFLILDDATGYHIGASLKDAGKKCFAITQLQDARLVEAVLAQLEDK